jgi:hypothetical protein
MAADGVVVPVTVILGQTVFGHALPQDPAPRMEYFRSDSPKDRKAERTGLRDPRIASVSFFPSAGAADLGASSRTPLDRGHKAARYQLSSSPHRGGIKTFVAHSAVPALPLPDARAPSASQRVVEIADAACRELDFAVQSGALPVSAELRR